MAFYTHTDKPIGVFVEKDTGNYFEYSANDDDASWVNPEHYPHKVWIGNTINDSGYRYAKVLKTVCYIIVDEDENGPVLERWFLKSNKSYVGA